MTQTTASSSGIQIITSRVRGFASNAVLLTGELEAVLVDTALLVSDTQAIIDAVKASGKDLKTVLVSHAHPDHYFGVDLVRAAFPGAKVYARRPVIDQMSEFKAKIIHWQEGYAGELPTTLTPPEQLNLGRVECEDRAIELIDLYMVESLFATAFYLPGEKTLIAADLVYSGAHRYMADVGDPDAWIGELTRVRDAYEIARVIPGHGPAGGPELIEASIRYLETWKEVAQPGIRVVEIARQMVERYPDYDLPLILWLTRGPAFGLAGARDLGVPAELRHSLQ
jgi:glyoxylase-like metal-dependent hydrolase (beta-lactamase superfamily II)